MKTSGILRLTVIAGIIGILAIAAPAGAAFFNFDDLPSPGPTPLVLPGVTFTPTHGGGVMSDPNGLTPPYAGNKCYFVNIAMDPNPTMLTITFDSPVFLVKFLFNSFGLLPFVIDARDINGNLLDSQYVRNMNPPDNQVVLCAKGIKSVVIKSNGGIVGTVYIDNFSFYPRAPGAAIIPLN
jgi:hypothetical protein